MGALAGSGQHTKALVDTAYQVLARQPEPAVGVRLLRDVLRRPPDDADLVQARAKLAASPPIQALAAEQQADGGWGPFHSRSTRLKNRIVSSEVGVERALALGLQADDPILERAASYVVAIMEGRRPFPDYHEKNDRWATGMRLFLASTLALILPAHPLLAPERALWLEIARRSFRSGVYSERDEIQAHRELTGATVKDSYLVLSNRYQLILLGSGSEPLPADLEAALLGWLWQRPDGIGYLEVRLSEPPVGRPGPLDRWLASHELLARGHPGWAGLADRCMAWLWEQRRADGLWDLGPRPDSLANLPLSTSWRVGQNRALDWTTRVLALLRQHHDRVGE